MPDQLGYIDEQGDMDQHHIVQLCTNDAPNAHHNQILKKLSDSDIDIFKKSACVECVKFNHDELHAQNGKRLFSGSNPFTCKKAECTQLFMSLVASNFQKRSDCSPNSDHPSRRSLRRAPSTRNTLKERGKKAKKSARDPAISPDNRVRKSLKLKRANHPDKNKTPSHQQSDVIQRELTTDMAGNKAAEGAINENQLIPDATAIDNMPWVEPRRSLNFKILDAYEERAIPDGVVKREWGDIKEQIELYDHFVRGGELPEASSNLRSLAKSRPFFDLSDINGGSQDPGMVDHQSALVRVLRAMFSVEPRMTVFFKARFLGQDIADMEFSTLLRGVLAYMLHTEIFMIKEDDPIMEDFYLALETLLGAKTTAETYQYCRLKMMEGANYKAFLGDRAIRLTTLFYHTLYPLTHQISDSPTNVQTEHYRKLYDIILASLELAAKMSAYQGNTIYLREEHGAVYRSDIFDVDQSQVEEVLKMSKSDKAKQQVAFTIVPAIQRTRPGDDTVLTYARGIVLLKMPYVD